MLDKVSGRQLKVTKYQPFKTKMYSIVWNLTKSKEVLTSRGLGAEFTGVEHFDIVAATAVAKAGPTPTCGRQEETESISKRIKESTMWTLKLGTNAAIFPIMQNTLNYKGNRRFDQRFEAESLK